MASGNQPTPQHAARLIALLHRAEDMRHRRVEGADLSPALSVLRTWQSQRLTRTYADLLASPRYGPAGRFFLSDMYAARDFSQRDHDIERLYGFLSRVLPAAMLGVLANAIALNELTQELDRALVRVLVHELGMQETLTAEQYAEGYRRCDNYGERLEQIELIVTVGHEVEGLIRLPLVATTLRLARGPAHRAGWFELQDFLERGYGAFRHMQGAAYFLKTIHDRELAILDRIYACDPDPFQVTPA